MVLAHTWIPLLQQFFRSWNESFNFFLFEVTDGWKKVEDNQCSQHRVREKKLKSFPVKNTHEVVCQKFNRRLSPLHTHCSYLKEKGAEEKALTLPSMKRLTYCLRNDVLLLTMGLLQSVHTSLFHALLTSVRWKRWHQLHKFCSIQKPVSTNKMKTICNETSGVFLAQLRHPGRRKNLLQLELVFKVKHNIPSQRTARDTQAEISSAVKIWQFWILTMQEIRELRTLSMLEKVQ